jgi:hypothetical protein
MRTAKTIFANHRRSGDVILEYQGGLLSLKGAINACGK